MKRSDFEAQLGQFGLSLSSYGDAAYYAACEKWSLSLQPFPAEVVNRAKLAIDHPGAKERAVIVDTFLSAANVTKTPQIAQALEAGTDFRGRTGDKVVTFTAIGSEFVLNVIE